MEDIRDRKLEQIRKLLDKAESPACPPAEAAALREKADNLMTVHAIQAWEADQLKPKHQREVPTREHIKVVGENHPLKTQLLDLFGTVVTHSRCRAVYTGLHNQKFGSTATVIGFPSDIAYVEMLYTSLYVQMSNELEPKPDPVLSEEENLAAMKEAGLKWQRIHELLYPDVPWERRHGVRYTKVYTDYCKKTGQHRMYTAPITYQRNFAEGYVVKVSTRLYEIRQRQQQEHLGGSGMELALRDIKAEVDEAYDAAFGGTKGVQLAGRSKLDASAYGAGGKAGARADLGQGRVSRTKELN